MEGHLSITFGNVPLRLLPEHAVWNSESGIVWIADFHIGKEQTFRRSGFPVPDLLSDDLARLSRILDRTSARQLVILGDLLHSRSSLSPKLSQEFASWRERHAAVEMLLVRGNHDFHAGDPPSEWQLQCVDAPSLSGELILTHYPLFDAQSFNLAGHLHPKFRMRSRAEDLKLPCFLMRRQTLVLPAYGQFIDHGTIVPDVEDDIYVVAEGVVLQAKRGGVKPGRLRR